MKGPTVNILGLAGLMVFGATTQVLAKTARQYEYGYVPIKFDGH